MCSLIFSKNSIFVWSCAQGEWRLTMISDVVSLLSNISASSICASFSISNCSRIFTLPLTRVIIPPLAPQLGVSATLPCHEYLIYADSKCVSCNAIICVPAELFSLHSNCLTFSLFFRPLQFCVVKVRTSGPGLDSMSPDRNNNLRLIIPAVRVFRPDNVSLSLL